MNTITLTLTEEEAVRLSMAIDQAYLRLDGRRQRLKTKKAQDGVIDAMTGIAMTQKRIEKMLAALE